MGSIQIIKLSKKHILLLQFDRSFYFIPKSMTLSSFDPHVLYLRLTCILTSADLYSYTDSYNKLKSIYSVFITLALIILQNKKLKFPKYYFIPNSIIQNHMNRSSKRLEINLQIDNLQKQIHQQSDSMPWMCYLCAPSPEQSIEMPNFSHKQKVNLSKITNQKKPHETISSDTISQRLVQKPIMINYPQYRPTYERHQNTRLNTQPSFNDRTSFIRPSYQISQTNRTVFPSVNHISSHYKNHQPTINPQVRYSYNPNQQDKTIYKVNSLPYNQSVKNTHMPRPSQVAQSSQYNATGTPHIKAFNVSFNQNQQKHIKTSYIKPENKMKSQIVRPKVFFNVKSQNINQIFGLPQCGSRQIQQMRHQNDALEKNNHSVFSTEEEIVSPNNFRQTVSIYEKSIASKNSFKQESSFLKQPKQLKFQPNRKKSSSRRSKNPNQTPKFLLNIKKATSGQSNGDPGQLHISTSLSDKSNYTHFGNKIKIGIRKAESFASEQSDEYSDVISQGGRSFLMPDIDEQEEMMSRMSSRSGFKNWEEDQEGEKNHYN